MYALVAAAGLLGLVLTPAFGCAGTPSHERKETVAPEPPREYVETALVPSSGHTIRVRDGDDLQDAIDVAQLGDTIVVEAGATFKGPFTLPKKTGTGWLTIRTSTPDKQFPPPGTRVAPSHAPLMPKLISWKGEGVVLAERGAHHYRFIGIELAPSEGSYLYSLMWFGTNRERTVEELPHHIIVDRCYLHGDPKKGSRRGVALNGRHLAVVDSYLSDFKEVGGDSQAILGWGGAGPFKISNNYLEGAGENIMFGGGDPYIKDLVPSDIEVRGNHLVKPLRWKKNEPGYEGTQWSVKNLFELKNARRVIVEGNVMEHSWEEAQTGFAVLFTVRNQDGNAPWSVVEDVQFVNNIVRHSGSGITLMGHDNNRPWDQSQETKRILIRNNLWEDIGGERWGGRGILFQMVEGTSDVKFEQNTGVQRGYTLFSMGPPHRRFTFRNNIAPHNEYGIFGNDVGVGVAALDAYFPDAVVTENVLAGGEASRYPDGNVFPDSLDAVPFADRKAGNYRLTGGIKHLKNAGVDASALCAAMSPPDAREQPICTARTADTRQHRAIASQ
ncbi:MAG TPA: hypothetical protein VF127_01910 [Nitrospira sp.]